MESLDELSKATNGKPGFFKHVFNFNDDSKSEMMNIVQYAVLALIPVILLNKSMQKFVPEADDEKGSPEILAEILGQVIAMFLGILLIHRIITFIPTYSGEKFGDFSITNIILAVLVIILSLQTKLGEKVSVIVDRFLELWAGGAQDPKGKNKKKNGNSNVRVSQPISQGQQAQTQAINSMGTTSISSLPISQPTTQQMPDYNNMYQQDSNNMGSGMADSFEPMAANSGGGGSAFGSLWS